MIKGISDYFHDTFFGSDKPELKLVSTELNDYSLFLLHELNLNTNEVENKSYVNEKFQTLLSACYFSNISIVNIFSSNNGITKLYIGFKQKSSPR